MDLPFDIVFEPIYMVSRNKEGGFFSRLGKLFLDIGNYTPALEMSVTKNGEQEESQYQEGDKKDEE